VATEAEQLKVLRTHRSRIRAAVEEAANAQDCPGYVTAWVLVCEVTSVEDGEQVKGLFLDSGDFNDSALPPWTLFGISDYGLASLGDCHCEDDGD
jgi:hypothetical protein